MGHKCCHTPLTEESAREILSENGINKTKVKIQILKALSRSARPLSVPEIHSMLDEECDLSTVFRTVTQFREKNLIREVNLDEGFIRFEMGSMEVHDHHHHHVRGRKCGDIKKMEKCDLAVLKRPLRSLASVKWNTDSNLSVCVQNALSNYN